MESLTPISIESVRGAAKKEGAFVIECEYIKTKYVINQEIVNRSDRTDDNKSDYILLITDLYFAIYNQFDNFDVQQRTAKSYWCDFKRIKINPTDKMWSILFTNKKDNTKKIYDFKFFKNWDALLSSISSQEIDTSRDSKIAQTYQPTRRGAFAHFLSLAMKSHPEGLSHKVKVRVAQFLLMHFVEIDILDESEIEDSLAYLLDSINQLKSIESISIPSFPNFKRKVNSLSIISDFLKQDNHIPHIEIQGPANMRSFHDFCTSVENIRNFEDGNDGSQSPYERAALTGITLDHFEFNSENLADLKTALIGGQLNSLGLTNITFDDNSSSTKKRSSESRFSTMIDFTIDLLLTKYITNSLRILTLDGNKNIDIQNLFNHSGNVEIISLKNCDIELHYVFECLSKPKSKIKAIDLSGNFYNETENDIEALISNLPRDLQRIDVNDVTWADGCLSSFLIGIIHKKFEKKTVNENLFYLQKNHLNCLMKYELITLSLSRIHCSKGEWQNVWTVFDENTKSVPIEQFSWNGNPVTAQFAIFLSKLPKLMRLFLNEVKNFENCSSQIVSILIENNLTFRELYIEHNTFKDDKALKSFFKKLTLSNSLVLLNMRHCKIGKKGLDKLAEFIVNCQSGHLNQIAFDGSGCGYDDIYDFVTVCKNHVKKLNKKKSKKKFKLMIELPSTDLLKCKAKEEDIEDLKNTLNKLAGIKSPKNVNFVWEAQQLDFYAMHKDDTFPKFIPKLELYEDIVVEEDQVVEKPHKPKHESPYKKGDKNKLKTTVYDENDYLYDEDDEDEDPFQKLSMKNSSKKMMRGFNFKQWDFPIPSVDNITKLNSKLLVKQEEEFSLRKLYFAVENNETQ